MVGRARASGAVRLILVGIAVGALGCGPRRAAWRPRVEPGTGAFAVVLVGTPLRTRPDLRAPLVPLESAVGRASFGEAGFATMRLRRARAGWLELETLGEPADAHCAGSPAALAPFRLVLYATEGGLVRVTAREVRQTFPDGTWIALARGVPVERLRGALHRVHLGPLVTNLELEPTALGTRYLPSGAPRGAPVATLDPHAAASAVPVLGTTGRVATEEPLEVPIHEVTARGSERLISIRTACGTLAARVPAHVVRAPGGSTAPAPGDEDEPGPVGDEDEPGPDDDVGATPVPPPPGAEAPDAATASADGAASALPPAGPTTDAPAPPTAWARAGARVSWPDGRDAGSVTRAAGLGEEREAADGRRCFAVRGAEAITICLDGADVTGALLPGGPAATGAARALDDPG